VRPTRCSN